MSARTIIEREQRWALPAALAAFVPILLLIASVVLQQSADLTGAETDAEQLRAVDENPDALVASAIVAALGFALMSIPLLYLFRASQARSEAVRGALIGFAVIGPVLLGVKAIAEAVALTDVAAEFVGSPGDGTEALADDLSEDSGALQTAQGLLIPAILAMIVGMIYIPLQAVRTGLLTRFFGTLGMALGASLILPLLPLFAILLWFVWLGFVFLDRVPGGRPPAWDAGKAIPWPPPGHEVEPRREDADDPQTMGSVTPEEPPAPRAGPLPRKRKRRS